MDLIDGNWCLQGILASPAFHPLVIGPLIFEIPNDRSGARRFLVQQTERVCLVDDMSMTIRNDVKFIDRALGDSRNEPLPDTRTSTRTQRMRPVIPPVEAANNRQFVRIRRPHAEKCALRLANGGKVAPQLFVGAIVTAFIEKIKILLG